MSLDAGDKAYIKEFVTDVVLNESSQLRQELTATRTELKQDAYRLEVLMEDNATTLATVLELLTSQLGVTSTLDNHTHRLVKLEVSDRALQKTVGLHSRQLGRLKGAGR